MLWYQRTGRGGEVEGVREVRLVCRACGDSRTLHWRDACNTSEVTNYQDEQLTVWLPPTGGRKKTIKRFKCSEEPHWTCKSFLLTAFCEVSPHSIVSNCIWRVGFYITCRAQLVSSLLYCTLSKSWKFLHSKHTSHFNLLLHLDALKRSWIKKIGSPDSLAEYKFF